MPVSFSKFDMGLHHHHWVNLYNRRAEVAEQLGQLPGETVLYRIDVVSLAKQSSQYGLQIIGTVSLMNSERAPAIYHLNLHLRNGLKTLKPAIINSWFTLS